MNAVLLDQYLSRWRHRPFAWGHADCVRFTAGWVALVTGRDPVAGSEGLYGDTTAALRLMRQEVGTADLIAATTVVLGPPLTVPLTAALGDVVAIQTGHGPALGLCAGPNVAVLGREGLISCPITAAVAAWKVGDFIPHPP